MKLMDASEGVGRRVGYMQYPLGVLERGTILRANAAFVFVRYDGATTPKATLAEHLAWLEEVEPEMICGPCRSGEHKWHSEEWSRIVDTTESRLGRVRKFYRCTCTHEELANA